MIAKQFQYPAFQVVAADGDAFWCAPFARSVAESQGDAAYKSGELQCGGVGVAHASVVVDAQYFCDEIFGLYRVLDTETVVVFQRDLRVIEGVELDQRV